MSQSCPSCGAKAPECIPSVAYTNVANYGSNSFNVKCTNCGNTITVGLQRIVECISIKDSDHKPHEGDWGNL